MCTQISLERSSRGRGGATRTRLSSESISRSFAEVIVSVWTHLGSLPACGAAGSCARRRRTAPSHRPLTRARGTQREVVVFPPSSSSPRAGAYTRETIGASPWYPVELTRGRSPPVFRANSTSGRAGARPLGVPSASLKNGAGKVSQNCDQLCFSRFETLACSLGEETDHGEGGGFSRSDHEGRRPSKRRQCSGARCVQSAR